MDKFNLGLRFKTAEKANKLSLENAYYDKNLKQLTLLKFAAIFRLLKKLPKIQNLNLVLKFI